VIELTVGDIAALTGGELVGVAASIPVTGGVFVDSRLCGAGSMFACIAGEHTDGHLHVTDAVARGAAVALAARPVDGPAVVVDDVVRSLGYLAGGALRRTPGCRTIGVTGSSGKTSTKDMIAAVLAAAGPTVAARGSLNNEIGLPLTVLDVDPSTRHLVLEYSARGVGHITYLCGIARPDVSVVLNVGTAHLGEFGSRAAVAQAKGELVEALDDDGVAVLYADDPLVASMRTQTKARVIGFGSSPAADVRVESLTLDSEARPRFALSTPHGSVDVALQLSGAHHAANAAAAAAVGLVAGMSLTDIAAELGWLTAVSPHRMQVSRRDDGLLVVDDAYNANPESVRAAVDTLATLARGRHGASWAVLGAMRELGAETEDLHATVGSQVANSGIDHLVVVGDEAGPIATGARSVPAWTGTVEIVPDADVATAMVAASVGEDDVVLVKASNALRLWRVAEGLLTAEGHDSAPVGVAT
jgi:UDP-N-acetylmuramoyl-tripeptide--D-alanyl-D-alanine ligase